ncbi:hypothetical protein EDB83DRAFT_1918803 [Lactarius deliciosus]|nr:hypothetical protein EDB83DRAFT_1918803 [Lactarius deliciosus]
MKIYVIHMEGRSRADPSTGPTSRGHWDIAHAAGDRMDIVVHCVILIRSVHVMNFIMSGLHFSFHCRPSRSSSLPPTTTIPPALLDPMSQHTSDPTPHTHHTSSEHDSHHDAHVLSLRLVLGSILAPKRPSHPGSHPVSGTTSPFSHWHHSGASTATGHDTPPPPPLPTPTLSQHQPHYQQLGQHIHQPSPSLQPHHSHNFHSHVHPQPQYHTHPHAYGPSRLSFTHSAGSTPPESLSPSPTPSPRLATPPLPLDHAPVPHPHGLEPGVVDSMTKTATATTAMVTGTDPTCSERARFLATLQSKSAWDALIHGSWV